MDPRTRQGTTVGGDLFLAARLTVGLDIVLLRYPQLFLFCPDLSVILYSLLQQRDVFIRAHLKIIAVQR